VEEGRLRVSGRLEWCRRKVERWIGPASTSMMMMMVVVVMVRETGRC
jgi:hypothetical protein